MAFETCALLLIFTDEAVLLALSGKFHVYGSDF